MSEMVCIACPMGCHMDVEMLVGQVTVEGNQCKKGATYAQEELTAPKRVVTSTVKISHGIYERLPVKTSVAIPKEDIFNIMSVLDDVAVESPIYMGDVIVHDVLGTGADIVSTRDM